MHTDKLRFLSVGKTANTTPTRFILVVGCVCCSGHMVPGTNPHEALDMFSRFISGESLTARSSTSSDVQQGRAGGGPAAEKGVAVA
jgi:hypothetical protein